MRSEKINAYDRKRYHEKRKFKHKLKCLNCGKDFTSAWKDQKCCSVSCGKSTIFNPNWIGGKIITGKGYIKLKTPHHPRATKVGEYVLEHILVMEKTLGRFLKDGEVVHHINGDKTDNRIENLTLFKNNSEHIRYHSLEKK